MKAPSDDPRERLLRVAAELFAERGYHAAALRELAQRADVNVATGHYHFGSKRDLYLQVLRAHFAEVRAALERRHAVPPPAGSTRARIVATLRGRVETMLRVLLGPPAGLHGTLMVREMVDPSEALPIIVDEFIRPMMVETQALLHMLTPGLPKADLERCAFSLVGQVLFYRVNMPAVLHMLERSEYTAKDFAAFVDHIVEFSIGGLDRLAARRKRARTAATPPRSAAARRTRKVMP